MPVNEPPRDGLLGKVTRRGVIPALVALVATVGLQLAGVPEDCAREIRAVLQGL